ncbi:MAG: cupin domain-containing protein [Phycisphaerales bacterium]|nr:cupin domain-containing protein [Phycisphaerales bacterium]
MSNASTIIEQLGSRLTPPADGTLSVTLQKNEHVKVVLFGFAAGQELSEHTASVPAMMHQLSGEAKWRIGDQEIKAQPGTWVYMPAHLPHALTAQTPCTMLLTLLNAVPVAHSSK